MLQVDLTQHCLLCRKRRVKCDTQKPSCRKCTLQGRQCPGYTKPLRIKHFKPENEAEQTDTNSKGCLLSMPGKPLGPSISMLTDQEHDIAKWMNLLMFYNRDVVPTLTIPGFEKDVKLDVSLIITLPSISQQLLELIIRGLRFSRHCATRQDKIEFQRLQVCCIATVRGSLPQASSDPFAIALLGTLTLCMVDIHIGSRQTYRLHRQALQHLMDVRGGFLQCWLDLTHSRGLLTSLMIHDVLSAAMDGICNRGSPFTSSHEDYLGLVRADDYHLVRHGLVIPGAIFEIIIKTNLLCSTYTSNRLSSQQFTELYQRLAEFEAGRWAYQVAARSRGSPPIPYTVEAGFDIDGWTQLGMAYQAAAILYLLFKTGLMDSENSQFEDSAIKLRLALEYLFKSERSDNSIPSLARHCGWPLCVFAFIGARSLSNNQALLDAPLLYNDTLLASTEPSPFKFAETFNTSSAA